MPSRSRRLLRRVLHRLGLVLSADVSEACAHGENAMDVAWRIDQMRDNEETAP